MTENYQTDPDTKLLIISPRVYNLRKTQGWSENKLSLMRLEQRGLSPVTYMHHVSKVPESKGVSYRVRICRTCSGLPTILELGSYHDVESALLVNDSHEILQGRYKNLHLLCREDVNDLEKVSVRKRGSISDQPVLSVIRDRIRRNAGNEANAIRRSSAKTQHLTNKQSGVYGTHANDPDSDGSPSGEDENTDAGENYLGHSMPHPQLNYLQSGALAYMEPYRILSEIGSNSAEYLLAPNPLSQSRPDVLNQSILFEQFKINILSLRTELLFWDYCSTQQDVSRFQDILLSIISPDANHQIQFSQFSIFLYEMAIPVAYTRCILSSLYPGEINDLGEVYSLFDEYLPIESLSFQQFLTLFHFTKSNVDELTSTLSNKSVIPNASVDTINNNLSVFPNFIRAFKGLTCQCDYAIRICTYSPKHSFLNSINAQHSESTILGCHVQLETCVPMIVSLIKSVSSLIKSKKTEKDIAEVSADEGDTNVTESEYRDLVHTIESIQNSMIITAIQSMLVYAINTIIVVKFYSLPTKLDSCVSLFELFTQSIENMASDKIVWQLYSQSYLDLICVNVSQGNNTLRVQAFKLGIDFVMLTKHFYWNVPLSIQGSEAVIFYESAFRSYTTILHIAVVLEESDYLTACGLDIAKLLNAVYTALSGLYESLTKQKCVVMSTQTLLSLYLLSDLCFKASALYPSSISTVFQIIQLSRVVLYSSSERFLLARLLIDDIVMNDEKNASKASGEPIFSPWLKRKLFSNPQLQAEPQLSKNDISTASRVSLTGDRTDERRESSNKKARLVPISSETLKSLSSSSNLPIESKSTSSTNK